VVQVRESGQLQHQFLKLQDLPRTPGVLYFLRDITYVDHRTHETPARFGEEVFLKANWFSDEKELRLGIQRIDCAGAGTVAQIEERLTALPRFDRLAVDLNAITEAIVINPAASAADRTALTTAAALDFSIIANVVLVMPPYTGLLARSKADLRPRTGPACYITCYHAYERILRIRVRWSSDGAEGRVVYVGSNFCREQVCHFYSRAGASSSVRDNRLRRLSNESLVQPCGI